MKHWVFILLSFFVVTISKGQAPGDINLYLKNPKIPEVAKMYYEGRFKASDDDNTFSIADSLRTKNNSTRPFYILLVSKMAIHADGALAEGLFPECVNFFEKRPDDLIEFLYSKNKKENFRLEWAMAIADGIDLTNDDDKLYLNNLEVSVLKKCKPKNRENIKKFCIKVKQIN